MFVRSITPWLLACTVALALAGCDTAPPDVASLTPPVAPKVPHVERIQLHYAATFAPGSVILGPVERRRLEIFLAQAAVRPNEHLYLAASDMDPLAASRTSQIVDLLVQRGIGAERIDPPPAGIAPNQLLLVFNRYLVSPPPCPDWSDGASHDNETSSNFGCANATNLSLMIDNPRDLLMGRALGPAAEDPALGAIDRYRAGAVKSLGGSSGSSGSGSSAAASGAAPAAQQ